VQAKSGQPAAPRFFRRGRLSERGNLALRGLAVILVIGIALGGHWLDREGLKDRRLRI
jgi:voltage-gated potassium channel